MKVHIGVDADTGLVHSMSTTAANVHDITEAHHLLHGGEKVVWCDAGYQGGHKREENLGRELDWQVAMRPGKRRAGARERGSPGGEAEGVGQSQGGASISEGEAAVHYAKVRYRGLAKNTQRLALLLGLGNLMAAEGHLGGIAAISAGPSQTSRAI